MLPAFRAPKLLTAGDLATPASPDTQPADSRTTPRSVGGGATVSADPSVPSIPRPDRDATRTRTSSTGDDHPVSKPKPAEVAALFAGLLGLVVAGAAWIVRTRTSQQLRRPTRAETDAIAAPVARIAMRHADLALLGPDLTDLITAGAATGAWLTNGPLLNGPATDPGIPADINKGDPS